MASWRVVAIQFGGLVRPAGKRASLTQPDHLKRAIARFHVRSSGQGNSRSPGAIGTRLSRTGRTFPRRSDRHTRHQNRSRAATNRSSQLRRSKCHQRPCGSKRALWPHLQMGMTDCRNVAASKIRVGTMIPSRDQRIAHSGNRSWS